MAMATENDSCDDDKLNEILRNVLNNEELTKAESLYILRLRDTGSIFKVFSVAHELCERYFDNKIFTYGFVYFTTYCRNDCNFCYFRRSNYNAIRYRKKLEEIINCAKQLKDSGVNLIDLTMSEDPTILGSNTGWKYLIEIIERVKDATQLPIMISPGCVPREALKYFKKAGADWLALYQETYNYELFCKLRPKQDYFERRNLKLWAKKEGMLVEDGMLIGVGEKDEDWVDSIFEMRRIGADQVREMGFVGQPNTPMEGTPTPSLLDEMKVISLMRLTNPDKLIPASYDTDGIKGLQLRLMAGANVITSLIPPESGFVGVAQAELDVKTGTRTVSGIKKYVEQLGFRLASSEEYINFLESWREK